MVIQANEARSTRVPKTAGASIVSYDILEDLLSFYMRSVAIALNREYEEKMAEVPLARATGRASTLLLVSANPGIRPSMIAHMIMKDRSSMTRLLNQLKRDGLLVEQVSAHERRAHELYLTDKGRAVVDALRPVAQSQSAEFFSVLSPEEQSQLLALLKTVYDHAVEIKSQTAGER